jgi:pilus assembly protein CpaC
MFKTFNKRHARLGFSVAATLAVIAVPTSAMAAQPAPDNYRPSREVLLSVGEGELVQLPRNVVNVWTSNPAVADVQVNSPRQIGLFGKTNGEATVIATAADGTIVYGAQVRVAQNISSIREMMQAAMPGADINVTHVGQIAVINGTVSSPDESAQAELLVRALLNPGVDPTSTASLRILPVNRLRVATPQQVMLKVTIAEVSRSLTRNVGVNLQGFGNNFSFAQGRDFITEGTGGAPDRYTYQSPGTTAVGRVLDVLGVDVIGSADLREQNGLVTILAEPSLTALSGETASFLAGGEFPIPVSQALGSVTVEFRQYGVGLAFSPTVLENGRISMRVRPEISELSSAGSIEFNGFEVPSLTLRRAETTVELGSGQSFVLAGLLRNVGNNSIDRTPFLGNLPIIGALFRSNSFRRDETELVIVVTPYLVNPVSAHQITLPTDGFRAANDGQQLLLGRTHGSRSGERRPLPSAGQPQTVRPGIITGGVVPAPSAPAATSTAQRPAPAPATTAQASARPGFEF